MNDRENNAKIHFTLRDIKRIKQALLFTDEFDEQLYSKVEAIEARLDWGLYYDGFTKESDEE